MPRDLFQLAQGFQQPGESIRARAGVVQSIQNDRTITVTIGGSTTPIAGVRYLASMAPQPGVRIWLLTDGADIFAFGHMAFNGATLSPRASRSTDQNITNAADEYITFDGAQSDSWGCWTSGQAQRLTAPITGRYMAVGMVQWAANGTGFRRVSIEKTGTSTVGRVDNIAASAGSSMFQTVQSQPFDMIGGTDYIRLQVRQNSGGTLAAVNSSTFAPSLSLIYLGP